MTNAMRLPLLALLLAAACASVGCAGLYYDYLERIGIPKRDVLVNRVDKARESQDAAKGQFADALEEFRSLVSVDAADLEATYDRLSREFRRCEQRASEVRGRIADIDSVAQRLFREWERELDDYSSADLRRRSEEQLRGTRRDYDSMMAAMQQVADRMDPVLDAFRDQVLMLKHNLNAAAIASLEGETAELDRTVSALIADMEQSIAEADAFLGRWRGGGA